MFTKEPVPNEQKGENKLEENNKIIRKKVFENLIIAISVMLYFILINFANMRIQEETLLQGIKIVSLIILGISIASFEIAYHKDSGEIAITGIEILVLAIQTLTIWTTISKFKLQFQIYILVSTYAFSIYYILKCIVIYTIEKRKYLNSLSDIHEILNNEPVKKAAKKRNTEENA